MGETDGAKELWSLMAPECSFFGSRGVPLSSAYSTLVGCAPQGDNPTDLEILTQIADYLMTD